MLRAAGYSRHVGGESLAFLGSRGSRGWGAGWRALGSESGLGEAMVACPPSVRGIVKSVKEAEDANWVD